MSRGSMLLPTQKNAVFLAIEKRGLDPRSFVWGIATGQWASTTYKADHLGYSNGPFFFQFAPPSLPKQHQFVVASPGRDTASERRPASSWESQLWEVERWLDALKREVEIPDLWDLLTQQRTQALVLELENEAFVPAERQQIVRMLTEFRELLNTRTRLTELRLAAIDESLQYLKTASERLGKKDWANAALGVALNIIVGTAIPPELAREAMLLVLHGVQVLAAMPGLLPDAIR